MEAGGRALARLVAGVTRARAPRPLVIAHRGASGERPENTLPAYDLAVEQRADMIEIDLHRTSDGAIVVAHDECLPGLPADRSIGAATLAQVRAVDAGGGARIPTLEEVLDRFGSRIAFNLEIKYGSRGPYSGIEAATLAALEVRRLGKTILFSSFDDGVLRRLRDLSPRARLGVLVSPRWPEGWLERCAVVGAEAVHFEKGLATSEAVALAHGHGLAVHVYTVDDPSEIVALLRRGCDGLFTNFPARMQKVLEGFPEGR
jgi:glycerophosphoryl diester phosphodiesterase